VLKRIASIAMVTAVIGLTMPAASLARVTGSLHSGPYAGMAWYLVGFELGPWEQYLVHELTPDLERLASRELPRVTWLHLDEMAIVPEFAHALMSERRGLAFSLYRSQSVLLLKDDLASRLSAGHRFEQSIVMPGVRHQVSDSGALTVTAVLASQRFGASGMNLQFSDEPVSGGGERPLALEPLHQEVSHGAGLRFALSSELSERLRLEAAFQSRIDMDEFASVRGVHGVQAELDIPPRIHLGFQLDATDRSRLNFGVSQVFYSEIGAFPSRALPARFTALLGDRNSPEFAWSDLVVYNLGWHWQHDNDVEVFVDYQSRSQPRPTAPALAAALDSELAQNAILAGFSKGIGRSRLHLNAAYAPPEFAFGGNILGIVTDKLDQELEVQAMLTFDF